MEAWKPTRVRWVDAPLGTSTGACRVETDAGPAYAKLPGNPAGPQALFCEYVGTRAAMWLGLPTFDVAVLRVEAGLARFEDGSESSAGPAYLARYEDGTPWGGTAPELTHVQNFEIFAGLIVLDSWLLNCDRFRPGGEATRRNTSNVFLSTRGARKGRFRIVAMDHTHCFTCGAELTKRIGNVDRVQDSRLYGHFPEFRPYLTHEAVRRFASRLTDLTAEAAERLLLGVPPEWGVNPDGRTALVQFLRDRAIFLAQNVRRMLLDQGELQPELELGG